MALTRHALAVTAVWMAAVWMTSPDAHAREVTVPVNVGVGPAGHLMTGPIQDDQIVHFGLKLKIYAVIDKATIAANKDRIPKGYRDTVAKLEEVRYSPSIFIPDTLIISPKIDGTQMYGISWAPLGLNIALARRPVRFAVGAALRLTYIFIDSDRLGTTHFLRPGLDVGVELEIPVTDSFLISLGWTSQFYIPQRVGGGVFEATPFDETIWHVGQPYLLINVRFPYTTNL